MDFGFEVIPLWEVPAAQLLTGDVGLLPLALLGRLRPQVALEDRLASVIQRLIERLQRQETNLILPLLGLAGRPNE
jgi:hypothetical protein